MASFGIKRYAKQSVEILLVVCFPVATNGHAAKT